MPPEQIRIAVAEVCWLAVHAESMVALKENGEVVNIPDYTGSLDAMHEAEKKLTAEEYVRWLHALAMEVRKGPHLDATPLQRAIVFLKIKGRWKVQDRADP